MSPNKKYLVCIVGPTAVGKTALSIELAKIYGAEIVSADSRQFYKELEIGTAKPSREELKSAEHHLINSLSIHDEYDVGKFEQDAVQLICELHKKDDVVVMVGGSGLFVDAVCFGLDGFPKSKAGVRDQLNIELNESGLDALTHELKDKDPEYYQIVDLKNPQRVIRALEVIRSTGQKFSSFRKRIKKARPFEVIKIGLEMDRTSLYEKIDLCMDMMIAGGLFEEAKSFLPFKELNALQTVGYQEIFPYLEGHYDYKEAVRLLKRNSRRYAKRQFTWFRKDPEVTWFGSEQRNEIIDLLNQKLKWPETKD